MFKDTSEITQNKIHALRLILLKKKKGYIPGKLIVHWHLSKFVP